jgi:hypothetical protein
MNLGDLPQNGAESRAPGFSQPAQGGDHSIDRTTFSYRALAFLIDPLIDAASSGDPRAQHCLVKLFDAYCAQGSADAFDGRIHDPVRPRKRGRPAVHPSANNPSPASQPSTPGKVGLTSLGQPHLVAAAGPRPATTPGPVRCPLNKTGTSHILLYHDPDGTLIPRSEERQTEEAVVRS